MPCGPAVTGSAAALPKSETKSGETGMHTQARAAKPSLVSRFRNRKRRGLALFDVILAVGIIGVLIAGGVLLLQNVQERLKRNGTLAAINQIRAETQRIYAGQSTMTGLNMKLLYDRGSLPDTVPRDVDNAPAIIEGYEHSYDQSIRIWPVAGKKQYIIGLGFMDNGPCADILGSFADKTRVGSGVRSLGTSDAGTDDLPATQAGGTAATDGTSPGLDTAEIVDTGNKLVSPVPAATVNGWCDAGDGDNNVFLHFQG